MVQTTAAVDEGKSRNSIVIPFCFERFYKSRGTQPSFVRAVLIKVP